MRYLAVILLTVCQFTAFPFLAMVTANTVRQDVAPVEVVSVQAENTENVTTVYKAVSM
jgi:hypothetical protein